MSSDTIGNGWDRRVVATRQNNNVPLAPKGDESDMTKKSRQWGRWVAPEPAFKESGQARLYIVIDSTEAIKGDYVLKELKNPKRLNRFNTELQAIASLKDHVNLVPLVDSGIYRDPQKPSYVMPKADATLEDYVKSNPKTIEDRLCLFDQICEGVACLHENKPVIIHRDLKPENVLMFSGIPKIADLGLCLIAGMARVTPPSEAVGSRFYMAPELEDGKNPDVSCAADVYSLGKILYYLLSDGKVFSREKYRDRNWYLPDLLRDDRLELFNSVFDRTILEKPSQRYANARELQKAFRDAIDEYHDHPLTTLAKKFKTIEHALQASEADLQSLEPGEWNELLKAANRQTVVVSQELLKIACSHLNPKFVLVFAETLLENEDNFDPEFLGFASGRLLQLGNFDPFYWLRPGRFSRLALHALSQQDDEVVNAIARFDWLILRNSDDVIKRLADRFWRLSSDAKENFLFSSMESDYPHKEDLLLSLSHTEEFDKVSVEAVVGGLCACATPSAIARVIEIVDNQDMDKGKLVKVVAGIVRGSSEATLKVLSQHDWRNPVVKVIMDTTQ
jgi:serine/threonine protein kinase